MGSLVTYNYTTERAWVFTEQGQPVFLAIRDRAKLLLNAAGACTLGRLIEGQTGDSFHLLACVDRLAELGEIAYVDTHGWKQDHVIVSGKVRS